MAMKTVVKKLLKFAPLKTDFLRAMASDESIKNELSVDMTEVNGDYIIEGEGVIVGEGEAE